MSEGSSSAGVDFGKLRKDFTKAKARDDRYSRENDAKFRAVSQRVATYEEFKDIVDASHLQPLSREDRIQSRPTHTWNVAASRTASSSSSLSSKAAAGGGGATSDSTAAGAASSTEAGAASSTEAGAASSTEAGAASSTEAGAAPSTEAGAASSTEAAATQSSSFTSRQPASSDARQSAAAAAAEPGPDETPREFLRLWRRSPIHHYKILIKGSDSVVRAMMSEMTSDLLATMISVLEERCREADAPAVLQALRDLSITKRFRLNLDFFSSAEKAKVTALFQKLLAWSSSPSKGNLEDGVGEEGGNDENLSSAQLSVLSVAELYGVALEPS